MSSSIFKTDTIYKQVLINGELFDIRILSDKLDCNLDEIKVNDDYFGNIAPQTIIITNNTTGKIVFHKRVDENVSDISFFKVNGNLSSKGKLY
ncbi:MAG: hypothetical protein FGM54_00955, partial [Chitinophagaceae bacterium]|nr:hypothetical protein [Chitinophagaceae bacterium]